MQSLKPQQHAFWKFLGITFLLFSVDAMFDLHFRIKMSTFGRIASYDQRALSHYLWIIPYFLVFGFLILKVIIYSSSIAVKVRRQIAVAALLFLFGAVFLELAGTYYFVVEGKLNLLLMLIKTGESLFQMIGSILFINTFLFYYNSLKKEV
ncbi:hypothetical protein [Chryseosolibacter indicus]|uniref:Uncharacterized protein n=1 Tax=Chryseosolibacter indicus TaxID=2782351 RepID=A0ABS5VSU5_9BACT|nr:hypothetical protein [Chryseosolibacter indicus]MBT1704421.1 hypothetical protein [Chryseosolibacter indicus]